MSAPTTVTLEELVEDTLSTLYHDSERPLRVAVGSSALADASSTTFTLTTAPSSLAVTDLLEYGEELMVVTGISDVADPVYTVSRGYAGTTALGGIASGEYISKQPLWPRVRVRDAVLRFFKRDVLPSIVSEQYNIDSSVIQQITLPSNTMRVLGVRHSNPLDGRIIDLPYWQFEDYLPLVIASTGKALRVSKSIVVADEIIVTRRTPWEFTTSQDLDPASDDSIQMPVGSSNLPVLFATAYLLSGHEVKRSDLSSVGEWSQEAAIRNGTNIRLVAARWKEFWSAVDDARSVQVIPKHRPFRKMARRI